ncbi:Sec63 [Ceratobasidium sp. 414]|nr:Sec63 [Ceratobasidium sp. 414]
MRTMPQHLTLTPAGDIRLSAPRQHSFPYLLCVSEALSTIDDYLICFLLAADWCRGMFKFGVFNAMQSQCFATVSRRTLPHFYFCLLLTGHLQAISTNSNMVISAPTGAGKTVLFELAVIKLIQSSGNISNHAYKCVYMAPTKAICSERHRDWSNKFSHIGAKCNVQHASSKKFAGVELTGDTMVTGRQALKEAKDCAVIITTPEKWDSLTRNWYEE